jgi:carbamate kinase
MRVVAALGGNALLERGERPDSDDPAAHIARAVEGTRSAGRDHDVVITHGNGPQVGLLALESDADRALSRALSLDVLGAQTQGMIGYSRGWQIRQDGAAWRRVVPSPEPPSCLTCPPSRCWWQTAPS